MSSTGFVNSWLCLLLASSSWRLANSGSKCPSCIVVLATFGESLEFFDFPKAKHWISLWTSSVSGPLDDFGSGLSWSLIHFLRYEIYPSRITKSSLQFFGTGISRHQRVTEQTLCGYQGLTIKSSPLLGANIMFLFSLLVRNLPVLAFSKIPAKMFFNK